MAMRAQVRPVHSRQRALLAAVAATVLGVGLVSVTHHAAAELPAFTSAQPVEALDYATGVFGDAWDYSNSADLYPESVAGATGFSMANGAASYSVRGSSYIVPLFGGYPGSLRIGRNGNLPANRLDARTFTRVHVHIYVSRPTPGALLWFNQDGQKGLGGMHLNFQTGWHDYDYAIVSQFRGTTPWAGQMQGLRLQTYAQGPTNVSVDFLRIYQPSAASRVTWQSPTGQAAQLYWSSTAARPAGGYGSTWGPVVNGSTGLSTTGPATADLSGYPPNTAFYTVSGGHVVGAATSLIPRPNVVVDSPSSAGCGDFATHYLGHPWRFTSTRDLAGLRNVTNVSFAGGVLSATNGAPSRNDPQVYLPTGSGIDGRRWHRLTLVTSYDGAFNLGSQPGGGTMARFMWKSQGQTLVSQTNDLVTYAGKRSIAVDLAMPVATLTEPDARPRYAFAAAAKVTQIRFDPNEDPGARRWHIYSVRLAEDCWTQTSFNVAWHDSGFISGARATIYAVAGSHIYTLGTVAEYAGANNYSLKASRLPAGRYTVKVTVANKGAVGWHSASGPLIIAR
ncbi:MAG TPA: hypothetical protein VGH11_13055 [Jatrophihabitans sp.]|jgi:hypothetical protein